MAEAHFRITARLDGPPCEVDVTIDRERGLFMVHRVRKHGTWTYPLAAVAEMVYARAVKEEVNARMRK